MSTPETADLNDIRVLIIADDPLARAGLATLLAEQPGCVVVGQISYADTGQLNIYRPDVLLWDLGWDADAALEQPADIEDAGLPIVALLGEVGDAADALSTAAGAELRGLLPRETDPATLTAALIAVAHGLTVFDPALTGGLPAFDVPGSPPAQLAEPLTPRELEVLQLIAEGLSNKMIAQRLSISDHTVKFHVNALMGKLAAQSRTEAVVKAMRLGLIML